MVLALHVCLKGKSRDVAKNILASLFEKFRSSINEIKRLVPEGARFKLIKAFG
jgi:hypothetical protein